MTCSRRKIIPSTHDTNKIVDSSSSLHWIPAVRLRQEK
jgi:hypothetical protein